MSAHGEPDRCISALVPQAAIDAAVLAASKPTHDDGHTDCFYAGILLAAWPHLNGDVERLRAENERLRECLGAAGAKLHELDLPVYADACLRESRDERSES